METTSHKTGREIFNSNGSSIGFTLSDYWSWSHSDLVINIERGKLAEFIVATALGITNHISTAWDSFDLSFMGRGVEVKSSSYLQSWYQKKESSIGFGVQPTHAWSAETGEYSTEHKRQADVYVFCLLKHKDKSTLNPLNLDQWDFYIVPTTLLNELVPTQKTISLSFFQRNNISSIGYDGIRPQIEQILNNL